MTAAGHHDEGSVNLTMPSQILTHIKSHRSASAGTSSLDKQHPEKKHFLALPIKENNPKVINSGFWNELHDFTGRLLILKFLFIYTE